jgi:hypothetical protein
MREKKLTSKRAFQESVVVLPSGDSTGIDAMGSVGPNDPALSTRPSRCPNCSSAEVTASCEVFGSALRGRSVRSYVTCFHSEDKREMKEYSHIAEYDHQALLMICSKGDQCIITLSC